MTAPSRLPGTARVTRLERVTDDVLTVRLAAVEGGALARFSAGSHVLIDLPAGRGMVRNAYSLISDPADPSFYEVAVCHRPGGRGGSVFAHQGLRLGDTLRVSAPANLFPLDRRGTRHVMVAGGIGVTPFLSMMTDLMARGVSYELHLAVRSGDWLRWAAGLRERFGPAVFVYDAAQGRRLSPAAVVQNQPQGARLYICGPDRLVIETATEAALAGWPASCVHTERFAGAEPGAPFVAELACSGGRVAVGADESLLEALERAGIAVPHLCRGGACGQCETAVVAAEGTILHRDHWLSEQDRAAGTKIMPCVSRFRGSRLVLAL